MAVAEDRITPLHHCWIEDWAHLHRAQNILVFHSPTTLTSRHGKGYPSINSKPSPTPVTTKIRTNTSNNPPPFTLPYMSTPRPCGRWTLLQNPSQIPQASHHPPYYIHLLQHAHPRASTPRFTPAQLQLDRPQDINNSLVGMAFPTLERTTRWRFNEFYPPPTPGLVPNQDLKGVALNEAISFVDELVSLGVLRLALHPSNILNNFPLFFVPKP